MSKLADRAKRLVNLDDFSDAGDPIRLVPLDLECPKARQYILRMPVRVDGGAHHVPEELAWLDGMLAEARSWQRYVVGVDHPFCYVTVRHGIVDSQTDDEWHVDGFSMKVAHVPEQNYTWCSTTPTEYVPLKVVIPTDFDPLRHNINRYLERFVDEAKVRTCLARTVYCMDPYLLHRRPKGTAGAMRTFVRISFVPIEINDIHNTQNPLLPRHYTADGVAYRNQLTDYQKQAAA